MGQLAGTAVAGSLLAATVGQQLGGVSDRWSAFTMGRGLISRQPSALVVR
jgi:hypothetical protein